MTKEQRNEIEFDLKNEKESALANGYKYTYCGVCRKKIRIKKAYGAMARAVENDDGGVLCAIQFVCKKCFRNTENGGMETINEVKE